MWMGTFERNQWGMFVVALPLGSRCPKCSKSSKKAPSRRWSTLRKSCYKEWCALNNNGYLSLMSLYARHLHTWCSSLSTSVLHSLHIRSYLDVCDAHSTSISERCDDTMSCPKATSMAWGRKASKYHGLWMKPSTKMLKKWLHRNEIPAISFLVVAGTKSKKNLNA